MILQATVEGVSTRKDRTIKIILGTQELSPKDAAELLQYSNSITNVYLSKLSIQTDIMHEIDKASIDMVDNQKSPSKRLKSVLYLLWKQDNEGYEDSELYYRNKMEQLITHFKNKLEQ